MSGVHFAVSDESATLRDAAAHLLAAEAPADVVRAGWADDSAGVVDAVWRKLADIGAVGVLVGEADGGLGLDENSLVALLEPLGRSALPVPAVETIAVAAPLLVGTPWLERVLTGRTTVTASLDGSGLVPFSARADLIVVGDRTSARLYERDEVRLEPVAAVDGSRSLARIVSVSGGRPFADGPVPWNRGVLGTSALLVGLARRMLEMTVRYVGGREQYGVPVGSFQAIKHALASALLAVEFAWPLVLSAAWAQSRGAGERETAAAKISASDAARLVARTAIQCHGAMGYTTEYDLHLFAKRGWALAATWGDMTSLRAWLADELGV